MNRYSSLIFITVLSATHCKTVNKRREPNSVQCFKNEDCMSDCCISTNGKTGLCVGKPQVGQICGLFIALPAQWSAGSNVEKQPEISVNIGRFNEQTGNSFSQNFGGNFMGQNQFSNFQRPQMQQQSMGNGQFFNPGNFQGFYQSNSPNGNSQYGFPQQFGNFNNFGPGQRSK